MIGHLSWDAVVRAVTGAALLAGATLLFLGAGFLVSTAPFLVGLILLGVLFLPLAVSPTLTLVLFLSLTVFANYVSSWLPATGAFPSGAILRDGLGVLFIVFALFFLTSRPDPTPSQHQLPAAFLSAAQRKTFFALAVIFLIWVTAAILISDDMFVAVYSARNLLLYPAVAAAAFLMLERGHVKPRTIGFAVLIIGFLAASLGVLDALTQGRSTVALGYDTSYANVEDLIVIGEQGQGFLGFDRASGGITDAVSFGYLAALVAFYAAFRLLFGEGGASASSRFAIVVFSASTVACALSLTRGAMLTLAVGLLLLLVWSPRKRRVLMILTALGLTTVFLASGSYKDVLVTRIASSDPLSQRSTEIRFDQADYGLDTLKDQPFGTGLGSEGFAQARYQGLGSGGHVQDNYLLIVALQIGIPGALAMLALVVVLLRAGVRYARVGGALTVCLIAVFLVTALLSHSPDNPVFAAPFWLLVALSLSRLRAEPLGESSVVGPSAPSPAA